MSAVAERPVEELAEAILDAASWADSEGADTTYAAAVEALNELLRRLVDTP